MKKTIILSVLAIAASVACTKEEPAPYAHQTRTGSESLVTTEGPAELEGTLIVELDAPSAKAMRLQQRRKDIEEPFRAFGARSMERLFYVDETTEPSLIHEGMDRWYRVKFSVKTPVREAASKFRELPGVKSVEVERRVKMCGGAPVNDTYYSKLWGFKNNEYPGIDINVEPVWESFTAGTSNVIVEIQDGGVDLQHEDLAAVTLPVKNGGSRCFLSGREFHAHDHGTHVAGTVGAVGGNGKGVAGVAGGTNGKGGVKMMSCQVFSSVKGDPSGNMANAMIYAAKNGAVISQNSWGNVYDNAEEAARGGVGYMKDAIDYFTKYAGTDLNPDNPTQLPDSPMKGGLVFFSAGNDNWPDGWPAEYDGCISVGALAPDGTKASFSNYGPWVDICAPGVGIYSCKPGGGYQNMDGTSMACPHVSGVAALVVSYFGGPGFTSEMLRDRILGGASYSKIPKATSDKIGPLVDAYGSMLSGSNVAPEPVASYTTAVKSNVVSFTFKVTKDTDDKKAYGYILLGSSDKSALESIDFRNIPTSVKYSMVEVGSAKVGESITCNLTALEFEKDYFVTVAAYDFSKNFSAIAAINKVTTLKNNPPEYTTNYEGECKVKSHLSQTLDFEFFEPDGHTMTLVYAKGSDAETLMEDGFKRKLVITGAGAEPGTYTAVFTATDAYKAQTRVEVKYEILENHPPKILKPVDNMVFVNEGERASLTMTDYLSDEDGETLGFIVSCNPKNVVQLYDKNGTLNLTTLGFGMATVTITAKDARTTTDLVFKVLVRDENAPADVYPNPVETVLNICAGEATTFDVELTNSAGAVVYKGQLEGSSFEPVQVDMSGFAPGAYGLKLGYKSKKLEKTIVKI